MLMRGHRGGYGVIAASLLLVGSLPLLVGQGCFDGSVVEKVDGGLGGDTESDVNGNKAPSFRFTSPTGQVQAEIGDDVYLAWTDSDPDNDAQITLLLDSDAIPTNGNETPIVTGISEDDPTNSYIFSTSGLSRGLYSIVARISDGVNPEVMVAAGGQLNLLERGSSQGNVSPLITVSAPARPLSVADGSEVTINYCGRDRDGGNGGVVADVIITLDTDNDPLNDLFTTYDPRTPEGTTAIASICSGDLPLDIGGAVVLGCVKDDGCTDPATGTDFELTVDAALIPQPAGGEPYKVRVSMWDHTNPPVHAYAPGTLSLTHFASGTVDLGQVGRTLTGARFIGFDTGAQAGFTGTNLGDYDSDGADDFVVVARFGRPFERGPVGSAYLVYGTEGERFGSDIFLNSYGMEYRGCGFASGHAGPYYRYSYMYSGLESQALTDGIVAVTSIEDLTGDTRPEILFGLPYAEGWFDYHDDDPCDEAGRCYFDGMPNPLMTDDPDNDDMSPWDYREGPVTVSIGGEDVEYPCSNDGDYLISTPLNQGYIVYVSSSNIMEDTMLDISMTGQKDPDDVALEEGTLVSGSSTPTGARLRGGWYSFSMDGTSTTSSFDPYNQFGRTLGTMPDLGNGGTIPTRDGNSEFLISLPNSYAKRGSVTLTWGHDLASFGSQEVKSIPYYEKTDTDPCYRVYYFPDSREILGAKAGDEFGYANRAGDFNRDGHQDILAGAPGSDNGGIVNAGTVYVIFGRLDFGHVDLSKATDPTNPSKQYIPRIEIRGTNNGDRFGEVQTSVGDLNNDGYNDFAFSSKLADGPGGADSGYVGIVFGGRAITGELIYEVNRVGTPQLPGCALFGSQRGGHAGHSIANIGDFNSDNIDDLLISAPDEVRVINGQTRRGVAYLVFGGPHLANNKTQNYFTLDQVGTTALPGIVFVSPYTQATADEATITWVGAAGDVDGDGFADVLLGLSDADFVNPLDPSQRRIDAGEAYLVYGNNSGTNTIGQ